LHSDEIDVPPPGWSNPDGDGGVVAPHPDNEFCYGVDHSWEGQHKDYDNGKMDGFVIQNNPDGQRALFYEDDRVIPFYYALASTFSVGDQYHCSVLGPTWPNRLFLMAATSFGIGDNSFVTIDTQANPVPQLFHLLDEAGRTWKDYTDSAHQVSFFSYYGIVRRATLLHLANVKCDLFADIKGGALPDVSFVMGDEIDEFSDEGPSALPGIGGGLIESVIRAIFASPSWKDTAIFVVYDENGGIADHVPPVPACVPDGYKAHDGNNADLPGAFDTTGFRVPFIVVSPFARAHFASHTVHDHTSITRFIEARFGLPALTARDANATPPYEMFDFAHPAFMTPPSIAAHTIVPTATLTQCNQSLPPACNQ
jgi:phospholipase C